ncbi:MFS transporter [Actinocrispum wychmicini]|uniref:Sugar phosphate permease n=1 Tax=Actinocrispum wychmicini TaxID=1213861 RepID=A0A4R2K4V6_9PSEU|nr:MFS transporter [Actinocrispum wychmicini]TCO64818.1 sugar phosphate permease [Actinocrispum wychmicini]
MGVRRWLILAVGITAQAMTCSFLYGLPFLIPEIQRSEGLGLAGAAALTSTPVVGLLATLIIWGAAADRFGERVVMTTGMVLAGGLLLGASLVHGLFGLGATLALAGAGAASVNAASGRVVMGWFAVHERGLAMGIRQTAQPLGVGLAAVSLPPLGDHVGFRAALLLPAGLCLVSALLVVLIVVDPPRPTRTTGETSSPYRTPVLWRVHAVGALLGGPQMLASTYALTYLMSQRHWDPVVAGQLIAGVQVVGAAGRIAVGVWSDRVGSRLRPMRQIAYLVLAALALWALGDVLNSWIAVPALVATLIVSVADNGLGFTATAELAGPFWAGRALGVHNTGQNVIALVCPPMFGWLIGATNYWTTFLVCALMPLAGAVLTPVPRGLDGAGADRS